MSWTYWGIVIGLASLQDSRIVNHQQASRMTVWRSLDPCGSILVARSLWHEPVWDSMVETVGFGGVGVPISTRWMI
jgi:hypothetical protein